MYRPLAEGPRPVVLFYHGGSFMMNNVAVYDWVLRYLCRYGDAVVIGVDYRLALETKFPGGFNNAYAALEWAVEHASEIGGDPNRVIVAGDSSGADFAVAVSLMARDRKGPAITKQLLLPSCWTARQRKSPSPRGDTATATSWNTTARRTPLVRTSTPWKNTICRRTRRCAPPMSPDFPRPYSSRRNATPCLTKSLTIEWAKRGVRVNCISPGYIGTDLVLSSESLKPLIAKWNDMAPMGRLGKPEELQSICVYLAGDTSTFTTGSNFVVDGAFTCF